MLSKKDELDKKLKETTANLESKLIKAAEINIDDDEEGEEDNQEQDVCEFTANFNTNQQKFEEVPEVQGEGLLKKKSQTLTEDARP
jgi:hypothetical protein